MMKYIAIGNTSEIRQGRVAETNRMRNRRHRRQRFVLGLALTATVIIGIAYVIFMSGREDTPKVIPVPSSVSAAVESSDAAGGSDAVSRLKALGRENREIKAIAQNAQAYPESLLKLLAANQETLSFVQNYPNRNSIKVSPGLTKNDLNGKIPLFLQWDKRWGYNKYGDDMLALTGCGPTCLSMVIVGLKGNLSANPGAVAAFSQSHGYSVDGDGTDWRLMTSGAAAYGLKATEVPLWENSIIKQVQAGHPVICVMGPGVFTTTGHFIVIYGYKNGQFLINDPNNISRSKQTWSYESFESQVRNLWAYSTQ